MERKLTAILCADVHGYSRLMGANEEATVSTLNSYRGIIDSLIAQHHGRFVGSAGDSVLAEFASVVEAVQCAVDIQASLKAENAALSSKRRMEFRIGINLGDVIVQGDQLYGDGVNVAARLESVADPGGICISGTVHDHVRYKLPLAYENVGEQSVKNITHPVQVWRVKAEGAAAAPRRPIGRVLKRVGLSLAAVGVAIAGFLIVQHVSLRAHRTSASIPPPEKPALSLPNIPSIAVLPFTNLSGDPQQNYFSDGISAQLISELSRLSGLFVIARNSSFSFKGKTVKEQEVGRALGVKYLLEGSVQKPPDRIRISVELVDAASGGEIWSQRFDRPLTDIFAIQDEIVSTVAKTVGLISSREETKVPWGSPRPTSNLEAYDELLRAGEYSARFTKDDRLIARRRIQKAIELDPEYADAYASLAQSYSSNVLFGWSQNPEADLKHASDLARKALALDDSEARAMTSLCAADWLQRRFDEAVAECNRAVSIDPNSAFAYQALSHALTASDEQEGAVHAAEKAMRLDPSRRDFYAYFIAGPYVLMGRYEDAIPLLKRHLSAYPNQPWAHASLILAYTELGRYQEARAEAVELKRISPEFLAHVGINKNAAVNKRFQNDLRRAGMQ